MGNDGYGVKTTLCEVLLFNLIFGVNDDKGPSKMKLP